VEVAEIILKAQLKYGHEHLSPITAHIFANAFHFNKLGSTLAPLVNRIESWPIARGFLGMLGISGEIDLPAFIFINIELGRRMKGKGRKVVFFYVCHLVFNRPDIGRKIRDLLVSVGCRVVMPRQTCCGLPALGNGDLDIARKFAQKNAAVLTKYIDRGFDVVYACSSCGLTLMRDYPGILDVPGGKKIAENTYNVYEYLLPLLQGAGEEGGLGRLDRTIAYHIPCHLRALGIGYPAARLFALIEGLTFHVLDDNCCGMAGTYGFKKRNQDASRRLGVIAAGPIRDLGVDAVVSDCGACRMQLGHFADLPPLTLWKSSPRPSPIGPRGTKPGPGD
jgi:glycerol-3-phosphate dehydrogenase subunit C